MKNILWAFVGLILLNLHPLQGTSLVCGEQNRNISRRFGLRIGHVSRVNVALNTIYETAIKLKRKPTNFELKLAGVPVDQWKGIGIYRPYVQRSLGVEGVGPKAHLRWNDNIEQAWAPILERLEDTEPSEGLSAEDLQKIISEIQSEIRVSWPPDRLREWSDEQIIAFILKNERLPRNYKRSGEMDFGDMGINYEQWTGTGNYKPDRRIHELALYPNSVAAWKSIQNQLLKSSRPTEEYEIAIAAAQKIDLKIARLGGTSSGIAQMPQLLFYLHRRADFASEKPEERKEILSDLIAEAEGIYESLIQTERTEDKIIEQLKRGQLHPIELGRLLDFHGELVLLISSNRAYQILGANARNFFSGQHLGAVQEVATEVVDEHIFTLILKGSFDRNIRPVDSRRDKLFYLLTLLERKLIDRIRAHNAQSRSGGRPTLALERAPEPSSQTTPRRLERLSPRIESALQQLPELQAEVIRLVYFQELTLSQIAEVQGSPLGTVKSRLSRGLVLLRELLGNADEFELSDPDFE